jgi:hypothetical protein
MKILIVGGLGYLGIELVSQLTERGAEYSVLDNKMWKNYSDYPGFIKVYEENYVHCDSTLLEPYDTIIYCSDIDVEVFYSSGEFDGYLFSYRAKIKEHAKKFPKKKFYYISSTPGEYHKKFLDSLYDDSPSNFNAVHCPTLYGISDRMRSDTLINKIIHDFIAYKQYIVEVHPFTIFEFESIVKYTRNLIAMVYEDKEMPKQYDKLPLLNIASLIQWEFGPDYSIGHEVQDLHSIEVDDDIRYASKDALSNELTRITRALEKNMCETFLTDSSNNARQIESAIVSKNFNKRIFE